MHNSHAITEIADDDLLVVDTKQLIGHRVVWIIEHKKFWLAGACSPFDWANATDAKAMTAAVTIRRQL